MELRTIAIRVEPPLHAQLTLLAKLSGRPLVEELRSAIDEHLARRLSEVDVSEQVQQALTEIDQEAASKRKAFEGLLGTAKPTEAKRGRKSS